MSTPKPLSITDIDSDIIEAHILPKLDGQSLASFSATSTQLNALCSNEKIWGDICNSTWPSTKHHLISNSISSFDGGHRSFFSDSFPVLSHSRHEKFEFLEGETCQLISVVDIYNKNELFCSKTHVTDTRTDCFLDSTFKVDLYDFENDSNTMNIPFMSCGDDKYKADDWILMNDLKESITLSWIIIDPTHKRATNLSSWTPVSVRRHWDGGDIEVKYATVVAGEDTEDQAVEFRVALMLGWEGKELQMRSVKLQMRNMDDIYLNGKDSLAILQNVVRCRNRKKGKRGEVIERYRKFVNMKGERREAIMLRKRRKIRGVNTLVSLGAAVLTFGILNSLILFAMHVGVLIFS